MKKIYLMTADGKSGQGSEYHLFLWDSALGELKKIADGAVAKEFKYSSHILLGNDESDLQVYQVYKNELQIVPVHSKKVELIQGVICCEREGRWFGWVNGREVELGEKRQLSLSFAASVRLGFVELDYFILSQSEHEFRLSFIVNAVLVQGNYSIRHFLSGDYIFAMRPDGNYDVYNAGILHVYNPEMYPGVRPYLKDSDNWIYFWDEAKMSWRQLASGACFVIADNAIVEHCIDVISNKRYCILYKVEGIFKIEVRCGKYELSSDYRSFEIGGMIYPISNDCRLVDFDSPRPTFKQKVKNLFKLLWKYKR